VTPEKAKMADSTFLAARFKIAVQIFSGGIVKHMDDIVLDRQKRAASLDNEFRSHMRRQASIGSIIMQQK
jgi:hypothetical protein